MVKKRLLVMMLGATVAAMMIAAACGGTSATGTPEATSPSATGTPEATSPSVTGTPEATSPTVTDNSVAGTTSASTSGEPTLDSELTTITEGLGEPSEPIVMGDVAVEEPDRSVAPVQVLPGALPQISVGGADSSVAPSGILALAPAIQFGSSQQVGISVSGRGEVTTVPDLAVLNAGVEARADTVELARARAAQAMEQIMQVLEERAIEDRDIQTRFFNISPEYTFDRETGRQQLVGFRVNNQLSVRIRDLENLGVIVDGVAEAGGDLVRIQGINFAVEETEALETEAREAAINDLLRKAQQFAELTGVTLGSPIFLSESGGFVSRSVDVAVAAFAEAAPQPETPISAGELTVTVSVQGVFAIE